MANDIQQLVRAITNLYTAVFERKPKQFNRVLRVALSIQEEIIVTEDSVTTVLSIPAARYYSDLAITGTYTQAGGIFTPVTVQYGGGVCDRTQMWIVFRVKPQWAYTAAPNATPMLFQWATDANNQLAAYYDQAAQQWRCRRLSGGAGANATVAGSHASNDSVTIAFAWTATTVKVSLNGAAWVSVANSSIPAAIPGSFKIGYGDAYSNSKFYWVIAGIGTLTDSEISGIHSGFGDTTPLPLYETLYAPDGQITFLWHGIDATHEAPSLYDASQYVS